MNNSNIQLLYDNASELDKIKKFKFINKLRNGGILLDLNDKMFNSVQLSEFISIARLVKNVRFARRKNIFDIEINISTFADKIVYLILEMVLYDLAVDDNIELYVYIGDKCGICSEHNSSILKGFSESALIRCMREKQRFDQEHFAELYIKNYDKINLIPDIENEEPFIETHFRRYFTREKIISELKGELSFFKSKFRSEVKAILKNNYNIKDSEWVSNFAEVVGELFDNACFHTKGDALIDIHIVDGMKANQLNINMSFICIADNMLYDEVMKRFNNDTLHKEGIYKTVRSAFETQLKNKEFNEKYTPEHFFMFANFQRYISTRDEDYEDAGTGLSKLLEYILNNSSLDTTYVMSNNKVILFNKEYLVNNENIFTLNKEKDINKKLDDVVVTGSNVCFPGTLFNIHLVKELD